MEEEVCESSQEHVRAIREAGGHLRSWHETGDSNELTAAASIFSKL